MIKNLFFNHGFKIRETTDGQILQKIALKCHKIKTLFMPSFICFKVKYVILIEILFI